MKSETRKLELIGFHETKRNQWSRYRRFLFCTRLQKNCNENTVYYSSIF